MAVAPARHPCPQLMARRAARCRARSRRDGCKHPGMRSTASASRGAPPRRCRARRRGKARIPACIPCAPCGPTPGAGTRPDAVLGKCHGRRAAARQPRQASGHFPRVSPASPHGAAALRAPGGVLARMMSSRVPTRANPTRRAAERSSAAHGPGSEVQPWRQAWPRNRGTLARRHGRTGLLGFIRCRGPAAGLGGGNGRRARTPGTGGHGPGATGRPRGRRRLVLTGAWVRRASGEASSGAECAWC